MSSRKRRKQTKQKLDSIPTYTIQELVDLKLVEPDFHLKDYCDYDTYRTNTDWWKRMGEKPTTN